MRTIVGTFYFVSRAAAVRYYRPYGYSETDVSLKIADGSIRLGKPPTKPGDQLEIIDDGTRYAIVEAKR